MKPAEPRKNIDIICPDAFKEASSICEAFISRLMNSTIGIVKIKVNTNIKLVECNDNMIKQYLDIILKSRKIDDFYVQFTSLLHNNIAQNGALLKCFMLGKPICFLVKERQASPDFSWELIRQ